VRREIIQAGVMKDTDLRGWPTVPRALLGQEGAVEWFGGSESASSSCLGVELWSNG
jgi:hypothetical protein